MWSFTLFVNLKLSRQLLRSQWLLRYWKFGSYASNLLQCVAATPVIPSADIFSCLIFLPFPFNESSRLALSLLECETC